MSNPKQPPKFLPDNPLKRKVAFYLPSKDRAGESLSASRRPELVTAVMNFLLIEMGGGTRQEVVGSFMNSQEAVTTEDVTICFAYCSPDVLTRNLQNINQVANSMAIEFNQESLAVVIDGEMYFFAPNAAYKHRFEKYVAKVGRGKAEPFGYRKYLAKELFVA